MVSPLWNAASEGDAATVNRLLSDGSSGDIEIKSTLPDIAHGFMSATMGSALT